MNNYQKLSLLTFLAHLQSGKYLNATGARRAIGKCRELSVEERAEAHRKVDEHFGVKAKKLAQVVDYHKELAPVRDAMRGMSLQAAGELFRCSPGTVTRIRDGRPLAKSIRQNLLRRMEVLLEKEDAVEKAELLPTPAPPRQGTPSLGTVTLLRRLELELGRFKLQLLNKVKKAKCSPEDAAFLMKELEL